LLSAALLERWPQVYRVNITLQYYRRIVSFPQQNFDEMRCKLDFTENPRSFEKYPTPPENKKQKSSPAQ